VPQLNASGVGRTVVRDASRAIRRRRGLEGSNVALNEFTQPFGRARGSNVALNELTQPFGRHRGSNVALNELTRSFGRARRSASTRSRSRGRPTSRCS
jgi:hypothetical protein